MSDLMDPRDEEILGLERACRVCGMALAGDIDDQPDPPLGPMCSECHHAREDDPGPF